MVNCQKFDFLLILTINHVTTGARELNGTSLISLATQNAKGKNAKDLDEVASGLARMGVLLRIRAWADGLMLHLP